MNVAIKLKLRQLNALIEIVQDQEFLPPQKIADKCMYYLYSSAIKKLLRRQIDKSGEPQQKAFTLKFKYEEATALYLELSKIKDCYGTYETNLIRVIITELRQKLEQ